MFLNLKTIHASDCVYVSSEAAESAVLPPGIVLMTGAVILCNNPAGFGCFKLPLQTKYYMQIIVIP